MVQSSTNTAWAGPIGFAHRLVEWWAVAGGVFLILIVIMNTTSVVMAALFGRPFAGDYEMTEQLVAVAAFAFLPYCQIKGANVTADIFTSKAGPRFIGFVTALASALALAFAAILLWQMTKGMIDTRKYNYQTAVLGLPTWYTYIPILGSLLVLAVASVVTLIESVLPVSTGKSEPDHEQASA
jgi:TRAP-type C4-dicarboxylate transport system permease small subunit